MQAVALNAVAFGLMLVASPATASVVIDVAQTDGAGVAFSPEPAPGWIVAQDPQPTAQQDASESVGDTLATYASLLTTPSDWVLLVTGFGVIGYAMRSRKRTRISFN